MKPECKYCIRCDRIISDTGGSPLANTAAIVEGGRIAGFTDPRADVGDAVVINLAGCSLLPGFVDAHAHAGEDAEREEPITEQHSKPPALRALRGSRSLASDLYAGTTTIRLLSTF